MKSHDPADHKLDEVSTSIPLDQQLKENTKRVVKSAVEKIENQLQNVEKVIQPKASTIIERVKPVVEPIVRHAGIIVSVNMNRQELICC